MPQPPGKTNIRFGVFEVNLRVGELRKDGHKIKLQGQPFQVLALLLERPGELVTREDLRVRLWPADTFVDFDHGLNAAIKRLRDALGDAAENPRFVETLARRGYRFIAPVDGTSGAPQPAQQAAAVPQLRLQWRIAVAVVLILLLGSSAGWVAARRFNPKTELSERRLTSNPADDPVLSPALSPDGKYLAFAGPTGLFLRIIATGETHSIALPDGFRARPVGWFPDGSHLLVTARESSQNEPSIWSVSVLGGSPRKLIDNAEARSVSPSGSEIVFVRGQMVPQEIWLAFSDGDQPRKIFGSAAESFGPIVWSPDGRQLAFERYTYHSGFHQREVSLWILRPSTGEAHPILSDARLGESLAWTPDGRLVYALNERLPNIKPQDSDSNLWAAPLDSRTGQLLGEPKRLTSGPDAKTSLSLSTDGKRLSFLRWSSDAHVYVAQLDPASHHLTLPRRLSLDEGRNFPYTWTPDGNAVLFTSDRDGPAHLFKQRIDQPVPDVLVGGDDQVVLARLNPDSSEVIYLVRPPFNSGDKRVRLMRMSLSGGAPQLILEGEGVGNFQCARVPSTLCIFGKSSPDALRFLRFDPLTGQQTEWFKTEADFNWSLSADGSTLALARWRQTQIQLIPTAGGPPRTLDIQGWAEISSIDWAADSRSLWASSSTLGGTQALLNIDLRGRVKPVFQDSDKDVGWAIPSPDGRRIALWEAGRTSNAWLLQGF